MGGSQSENSERKNEQSGRVSVPAADLTDSGIRSAPPSTNHPQLPSAGRRWTLPLRRYGIAVFLLLLSLVGFGFAFMKYPHASEVRQLSTPGSVNINISTKTSNNQINYTVRRKASITSMTLTAIAIGKADGETLGFSLQLPHGASFLSCNPPSCSNKLYYPVYKGILTYTKDRPSSIATITVQVNASALSSDANGREAVAVMPSLRYEG